MNDIPVVGMDANFALKELPDSVSNVGYGHALLFTTNEKILKILMLSLLALSIIYDYCEFVDKSTNIKHLGLICKMNKSDKKQKEFSDYVNKIPLLSKENNPIIKN